MTILEPDYEQAKRFLSLLDPIASYFTFQTFDENKQRKDGSLTTISHSSLDKAMQRLTMLNNKGAGIFYSINHTDGLGRALENILKIRAIWQDDDDGYRGNFPLEPSCTIQTSPGRFQRLWLVGDKMTRNQHKALMAIMVEQYGSDNNAKDMARLLRLPGFYHMKTNTPFLVRLVEGV